MRCIFGVCALTDLTGLAVAVIQQKPINAAMAAFQLQQLGGSYGKSLYGNSRNVSGVEALQGIQSTILDVADVGLERKSALSDAMMYPMTGAAGEFDIREQELVFSTGITTTLDNVSGITATYFSPGRSAEGVWSCWNGLRAQDHPILRGVAMTDYQSGSVARSYTNQSTVTVAQEGNVEPPCGDLTIRPGQLVYWDFQKPNDAKVFGAGSVDGYTSIGADQSGRMVAFVVGYNPAGNNADAFPVRLYDAMRGKKSAFPKFDQVATSLLAGLSGMVSAAGGGAALSAEELKSAIESAVNRDRASIDDKITQFATSTRRTNTESLMMLGILELVKQLHIIDHDMRSRICGKALQAPDGVGHVQISLHV